MIHDAKARSLIKSIVWRIITVTGEIFIANFWLNDMTISLKVILTTNTIGIITYYFHERLWEHIQWKRD